MKLFPRRRPVDVTFFNTFEEPISFFEVVLPRVAGHGISCEGVLSQGHYRSTNWLENERAHPRFLRFTWVPKRWADNKRVSALLYLLMVPPRVLFSRSKLHVFLSEPPLFYVVGVALSSLRRIPCIVYILDLQLDTAADLGMVRESSLLFRVLNRLSVVAMKRATSVVVLGRCMEAKMVGKGVPADKVRIVQLWSPDGVEPVAKQDNAFLHEHGLDGRFVVLYSGNMGHGHEFATILEVAASLRERDDIVFVFVGGGARRDEIGNALAEGAPNVRLIDFQDRAKLSASLSAADVHFVSLRPGCEGLMVPSKFYGAIATARPVIFEGAATSELALAIGEIGCGRRVVHRDAEALREAILHYRDDEDARVADGARARLAYETSYTEHEGAARVIDLVLDALPDGYAVDRG